MEKELARKIITTICDFALDCHSRGYVKKDLEEELFKIDKNIKSEFWVEYYDETTGTVDEEFFDFDNCIEWALTTVSKTDK